MRPDAHEADPRGAGALRLVFWETTVACNLECAHCRRLEVSRELAKNDLTTEEGYRLIDEVAAVGSPILVFSGGEPLMRPDIFDLAAHARDRELPTALASNGSLIDTNMAVRIVAAGFRRVSVSLDGAGRDTHDRLRKQPGSFDAAVRAVRTLKAAGVGTQINCTIARHDQHEIGDVLRLGERLGVDAVHYFLLVPVGCGEQIAEDQMLSADEIEVRLGELYDLAGQTELEIKATCAPHYYRIVRQRGGRRSETSSAHGQGRHPMSKGCLAGTAVCFVSHEGDVFPCGYLPVSAGSVRRQGFGDIWRQSEVFARLRDPSLLSGKCGMCEFKGACSGCRARAFYQFGDYLAEEPYCAYEPVRHRQGGIAPGPTSPQAVADAPPAASDNTPDGREP